MSLCVLKCLSILNINTHSYMHTSYQVVGIYVNSSSHNKSLFPVCHLSHKRHSRCDTHNSVSLSLSFPLFILIYLSPFFCVAILGFYPLIVCLPSFLSLPLLCSLHLLLPPLCLDCLYLSTPSPLVAHSSFLSLAGLAYCQAQPQQQQRQRQ